MDFALYKAISERAYRSWKLVSAAFRTETPRLILMAKQMSLAMDIGFSSNKWRSLSAVFWLSSFEVFGNNMENSSPPIRANISSALMVGVINWAILTKTWSPIGWPYLSLIVLKRSTSIEITASACWYLSARLNSRLALSKKYRRLYKPVNSSILASCSNFSFSWYNSVTSVEKPIKVLQSSLKWQGTLTLR